MSHPVSARLVLDEMFSPAIAAALRDLGQDVIAVADLAKQGQESRRPARGAVIPERRHHDRKPALSWYGA